MKEFIIALTVITCLTGCSQQAEDDASVQVEVTGTWTITGAVLPDRAQVSDVATTFKPDGSWITHYTVTSDGNSRQQTTKGIWQIEGGILYEQQTNVDGVADSNSQRGGSRILQIGAHQMVLSNWYSPRRVFTRKP